MDVEKALEKIKKCLALSKSSNEHEAAQALKHAHALMKQFNLDYDDVSKSELNTASSEIKSAVTVWHTALIMTIAKAFCAVPISRGKIITWHGYGINAELADYTYQVLFRQCNQSRTRYLKTNLKNVRKKANKTLRANIYAEAWCDAVNQVVMSFVTDEDLTTFDDIHKIVSKGAQTHKPRDRNQYKNAQGHVKQAADNDWHQGYRDGKNVRLHKPVGNSNNQLAIE